MYAVDLETSFAGKGSKRKDAWILQIGAANQSRVLDILVRPKFRLPVRTTDDLYKELQWAKQQPKNTIGFWSRILERKFNVKRGKNKAAFILRHMHKMIPLRAAMIQLLAFTGPTAVWYAHNGKSFDFPILRESAKRVDVDLTNVSMKDSLPLVRAAWPNESHKLVNVYDKHVSKIPYKAHLAADDAVALFKVLQVLPKLPQKKTTRAKESSTRTKESSTRTNSTRAKESSTRTAYTLRPGMIPGLGRVGCLRLRRKGIFTMKELRACAHKTDSWWRSCVPQWRKVRSYIS